MASVIRGNPLTTKVLIRYGEGSVNTDGSTTASVIYAVLAANLLSARPVIGTDTHPLFGTDWKCSNYRWASVSPKVFFLEIFYTSTFVSGTGGSGLSAQLEQEANCVAEVEPITSHPLFSTLAGTATAPANGAVWIDKNNVAFGETGYSSATARFAYFGPGIYFGQESYLSPKTEYRFSFSTTSKPSQSDVGLIVAAPLDAPDLPTGATWLLASRTWKRKGGDYNVTELYKASGPLGWNTDIYT